MRYSGDYSAFYCVVFIVGFVAYMGMLEMEHAHNHPVLRVFCHLLIHKQPIVSTAPQDVSRGLDSEIWVDEGTGPAVPHGTYTCPSGK